MQQHKTKQLRGKSSGQFTSVHVSCFLLITGSKYTMAKGDHGKGEHSAVGIKLLHMFKLKFNSSSHFLHSTVTMYDTLGSSAGEN